MKRCARRHLAAAILVGGLLLAACSSPAPSADPAAARPARNLVLITIDTLRADHVGAYGYGRARTPALDRLAREGARFQQAFATAPITLTSHASLLTGLYPAGHAARDNGVPVASAVPTLAVALHEAGLATSAFIAAYPLDRRFGLARGFDVYGDRMPRGIDGRLANERPGRAVVDEAAAWLAGHRDRRFFLWVHLFEPHAPYGDPQRDADRPAIERYDDEIAVADREVGRLLDALAPVLADTLVVAASDHGEAFGEHGEIGHSIFVYDTTLRVALVMRGPGVPAGRVATDPVSLVDVAPTALRLLGLSCGSRAKPCVTFDADGIDLAPALTGAALERPPIYAESFAPMLEFGWSPLRALRDGRWKAIAAPRPELYDVQADPDESRDLARTASSPAAGPRPDLAGLLARIDRFSPAELPLHTAQADRGEASARLGALGYVQGGRATNGPRADPKDRRELAGRIATVTAGEVQGDALVSMLRSILAEDPANGQMQLRLGDALLQRSRCGEALAHFNAAIAARLPSADPFIGLAACQARAGQVASALDTLHRSESVEPGNPVVLANIGLLEVAEGRPDAAAAAFRRALEIDGDFHEARFNLALTLARAGRRADALAETTELLRRLPPDAPQRPEVERLRRTLQ